MKFTVDTEAATLQVDGEEPLALFSKESFEMLSDAWVQVGWSQRYSYTFSWMGRPIIQLPEDMIRLQEVVHRVRPDVVVETGVAHGGSAVFVASLLRAMGHGRVVSVDVEIRPDNRRAIEEHVLSELITLVEGDSVADETVARVGEHVGDARVVLVVLDSNHSKKHVSRELEAYHHLVSKDSYIIATDGIMRDVARTPNGSASWVHDNPAAAAEEFAAKHPDFELEQPPWLFNDSPLRRSITYWPSAWLRRRS